MSVNLINVKCNGCRYKGVYLCTNLKECRDHKLHRNNKKQPVDKTTIILDQGRSKENGEEFNNEELEELLNDYIEWIKIKGSITGGGCGFDRGKE